MICPNCGYCENRDQPIERDGFFIDPIGAVQWGNIAIPITGAKRTLFHVLAASPRKLLPDALLFKMGSTDTESNVLASQISHLRRALRAAGAPTPIINDRPGYRWAMPD